MKKLKIIFVGTPDMALICLDGLVRNNFEIAAVVPPRKDHVTYNLFKSFVNDKKLNLLEFNDSPNEKEYIEKLKELNADIGVVCSYNIKLSSDFLKTTKMGYINCHPSLLPDYRGGMPYFHIIKNNEKTSGITLHYMDNDFDTGDIIYQREFEIIKDETMGTLFNRTNFMFHDALIKVLSDMQDGAEIMRHPQDKNDKYKKAPVVSNFIRINWHDSIDNIDALIRACNPFYNAYCYFRGHEMRILNSEKIIKSHNFECGKIVSASKKELIVAAIDGFISIKALKMSSWGIFLPDGFYNIFTPTTEEYLK